MSAAAERTSPGSVSYSFAIVGVPVVVIADPLILEIVDDTYGAYRTAACESPPYLLEVEERRDRLTLTDSRGLSIECSDQRDAAMLTIERIARHVTEELAAGGVYATHAAALVYEGRTVVVVGRSGAGKTTLALALVRQGLGMLSDELALSAPDARTILPYRRGLHIRPGTPELIEQLAFVTERPFHPLSSGPQWTLRPDELEEVFPECFAEPTPLGEIVLLERRGEDRQSVLEPVSSGIVAVELLQATPAAATDFDRALQRVGRLVDGTRCARLRPGSLESTVDTLISWLAAEPS